MTRTAFCRSSASTKREVLQCACDDYYFASIMRYPLLGTRCNAIKIGRRRLQSSPRWARALEEVPGRQESAGRRMCYLRALGSELWPAL
jgi:hypothetical protein